MKRILIILIGLFIVSCVSEKENTNLIKEINSESFSIPIEIINDSDYLGWNMNYYSKIKWQSWTCPLIHKFTKDSNDLLFVNTEYEIFFPRYYYDSLINHFKPIFYIIGYKPKPEMRAFFIIYLNKVQNVEEFNKFSSQRVELSNQIDETTDSVFTSLSNRELRSLFPKFKGNYKQIKIDKIEIDFQYLPNDDQFYNSIKLIDFEIGRAWKRKQSKN